jgi:hypothetical protein
MPSMKRNIKIAILSGNIVLLLLLSSCLKNSPYFTDFSKVAPSIDMPLAAFTENGLDALSFTPADTPSTFYVYVNVASPKALGKPINATLGVDSIFLNAYDTAQQAAYVVMPDSDYSLSTTTITVPSGQHLAFATLKIFTNKVDASQQYVLPLTITKADLPIEQWNHLMLYIAVKNIYDGNYTLTGYASHPGVSVLTGPYGPVIEPLATSGVSSVTMLNAHPWSTASNATLPGTYSPVYAINPANDSVTITNAAFGPSSILNAPGYPSYYDPATQTIYAQWTYLGGGGPRFFTDTLVYSGPR